MKTRTDFLLTIFPALLLCLIVFASCKDNTTSPKQVHHTHIIKKVTITPSNIIFTEESGIIDTTVSISISGEFEIQNMATGTTGSSSVEFLYQITRKSDGELIEDGILPSSSGTFASIIDIPVKTVDFNDYLLFIFALSNDQLVSNTSQSTIKIRGFAVSPPIIEYAANPDTVWIPTTGEQPFLLTARVFHPFEQSLIDRVLVNIRDMNNNLLPGSPFELFDDGGSAANNSGDLVASDSTFSRAFRINSSNNPDNYRLFYFAIDNLGVSSDTIQTQMVISR